MTTEATGLGQDPADLGYMYGGGWKAMVEDIGAVAEWTASAFPGRRRNLLGHSMGSMAVRSFTKRHDDMIDNLFVVGSPSDNPAKGAGRFLAGCISLFRGSRHPAPPEARFRQLQQAFPRRRLAQRMGVLGQRAYSREYHNDPLCQFRFTANGFST